MEPSEEHETASELSSQNLKQQQKGEKEDKNELPDFTKSMPPTG